LNDARGTRRAAKRGWELREVASPPVHRRRAPIAGDQVGAGREGSMNRPPRRVLLADSDVAIRRTLTWQLQDRGCFVVPAGCGSDVLLQCEIDPPDAIVMDVRLPDRDGYEICAQLRRDSRCPDVTIILMTEAADEMSRAYLAKMVDYAGGDYFVAKPCDVNLLVRLIDEQIEVPERFEHRQPVGSPTHVVWPTTRTRNFMASC
jgi:CheY-like chemotaxis protein